MFIWGQAWSRESYSPGMMKGDADQNMATTLSSISDQDHGCNLSCLKAMAYGQLSLLVIDWICLVTHWFELEELFVWLVWLWTLHWLSRNLLLTFELLSDFELWSVSHSEIWCWNLFLTFETCFFEPGVTFLHLYGVLLFCTCSVNDSTHFLPEHWPHKIEQSLYEKK